ncbi:MAG: hypothetical protein H6Q64_1093, partial [Firmicutes bacterium]|nr:hypothetical protein [Bacillota bacterium]
MNFKKTICTWLITVAMIIGMLSTDVLADTPGVQSNGLNSYVVDVSSDPSTSTRPSTFGTASDDGRVWADKSVSVNGNQFDITLSALAQEYVRTSTVVVKEQAAADVAIVIDMSSSMTAERISKMTGAVNKAVDLIMAANPRNRIGIYYYGLTTSTGTLLDLASYSTPQTGDGTDATNRYITCSNQNVSRVAGVTQIPLDGTATTTTAKTVTVSTGTATQYGLYTAVNILKSDIAGRTKSSKDKERLPYLLLFTDGEANRAFPNWYNDLTNTSSRGTEITGSGASGTAQISALTILSAAKLKDELSQAYKTYNGNDKETIWFNVAFGLTQGDNLATAILKPDDVTSTATTTLKSVYTQLNTYTTNAPAAYKKYGVGGTPGYQYAKNYIYFVQLSDMNALNKAFDDLAALVEAATQEKIIPFESVNTYGEPLNLLVTDVLGNGMELKTVPKMQGTTGTVKSVSGTVSTYEFAGYKTTVEYNNATREMKWMILPEEIPLIMFSDRKAPTPGNYSNPALLPMQLTYTVGLKDVYKSGTFYSNEYAGIATATTRFIPMTENPYYYKDISEVGGVITSTRKDIGAGSGDIVQSALKSSNITGTAATYYANEWNVSSTDSELITRLGNNGKIAPKMKIDKAPVSGSVPAGGNASYYITITNLTGYDISNVIIDDTLPAGLTFVVGSIKEGSDSKPTATFPYTISSVPANSSVVLTFQATVPLGAAIGTEYVNKAKITSANGIALTTPAMVDSGKVTVANTFSPQVTTKLDGTDYAGQIVTLWQGGMSKYTLSGSGSVYTLSGVTPGTYDIYVNGVNTGVQLSASDANKEINYYSVSFYDGDTKYTTPAAQTTLSGGKAVSPTAPTKTGYTFDKWVTTSGGTIEFDFNTAITATTNVYATWNHIPTVGDYTASTTGTTPVTGTVKGTDADGDSLTYG